MNRSSSSPSTNADLSRTHLWFQSLFHPGRGFAFPCDAQGQVDMDGLSDSARRNYFLVRKLIGYDYATPTLVNRDRSEPACA
jgi:hypothetical protein